MKTLVALLVLTAPLAAQEFTTQAAKAAKAKYEAALQAARDQYQADLDEAAKMAVEAGDLEEVVRIKDQKETIAGESPDTGDPIARSRQQLVGTMWRWKPDGRTNMRMTLLSNRRVKHTPPDGPSHFGAWDMIEPKSLVMKRRAGGLWVLLFEDDFKSFRVLPLVPQEHGGVGTIVSAGNKD